MTATFILVNFTYEMAETKAVPALLRALNERAVLDAVRTHGPQAVIPLARHTLNTVADRQELDFGDAVVISPDAPQALSSGQYSVVGDPCDHRRSHG
jgi:hypothetical protein